MTYVRPIVEQLREAAERKWPHEEQRRYSLFTEAADEIERLRAEVEALRRRLDCIDHALMQRMRGDPIGAAIDAALAKEK